MLRGSWLLRGLRSDRLFRKNGFRFGAQNMDRMKNTFRVINGMVTDGIIRKYAVAGAVAALNYIEVASTEDFGYTGLN